MDEETKELLLNGLEMLSKEVEERMNEFGTRLSVLESQFGEILTILRSE